MASSWRVFWIVGSHLGEDLGDPLARAPRSEEGAPLVPAVLELPPDRSGDLVRVVVDLDHVRASLAVLLPRADGHRRRAEEGSLAERRGRVAHHARAVRHQLDENLRGQVPEEVVAARLAGLAEEPQALRDLLGAGVDVGPEDSACIPIAVRARIVALI